MTLALLPSQRTPVADTVRCVAAKLVGAVAAGGVLRLFVSSLGVTDQTGGPGTNPYNNASINLAGALVLEVLLTAAFVGVILLVTDRAAAPGFAGIAIGLALTAVHLVGIPLADTSVNPARSLGPALFAGGHAMTQV